MMTTMRLSELPHPDLSDDDIGGGGVKKHRKRVDITKVQFLPLTHNQLPQLH